MSSCSCHEGFEPYAAAGIRSPPQHVYGRQKGGGRDPEGHAAPPRLRSSSRPRRTTADASLSIDLSPISTSDESDLDPAAPAPDWLDAVVPLEVPAAPPAVAGSVVERVDIAACARFDALVAIVTSESPNVGASSSIPSTEPCTTYAAVARISLDGEWIPKKSLNASNALPASR